MNIVPFLSGVTQTITNQTAPRSIPAVTVGNAFRDLAQITKENIEAGEIKYDGLFKLSGVQGGKNAININNISTGTTQCLMSSTGLLGAIVDGKYTNYIPVSGGEVRTFSGISFLSQTHNVFSFYDTNLNLISFTSGRTHTVPTNASYVRMNLRVNGVPSNISQAQYEVGSVSTTFEPYVELIKTQSGSTLFSNSKTSLLDVNSDLNFNSKKITSIGDAVSDTDALNLKVAKTQFPILVNQGSTNLINFNSLPTQGFIVSRTTGLVVANGASDRYCIVPVIAGQTYTYGGITLGSDTHYVWSFYDSNNTYINGSVIFGSANFTHVAPTGAAFVYTNLRVNSIPANPSDINNGYYVSGTSYKQPSYTLASNDGKALTYPPTSLKLPISGSVISSPVINGVDARIVTSTGYNYQGTPDKLMLICQGNGQLVSSMSGGDPSSEFIAYAKANKISYAIIRTQDTPTPTIIGSGSTATYSTDATGWGNYITIQRMKDLYNYCMTNYNFYESVVIVGQSMGYITAQHLAHTKPFPISDLLSIGGVFNGIVNIFQNAPARRDPIRAAMGMKPDGSDDANILSFARGYDNYLLSNSTIAGVDYKYTNVRTHIIMGEEVGTYTVDFGGNVMRDKMLTAIRNTGGYVTYNGYSGVNHAATSLYTTGMTLGIFKKIFGV